MKVTISRPTKFILQGVVINYSRGPLTGPTLTGPMLLENEIIDILEIHVEPRDQHCRTHEIYLKNLLKS